MAFCAACMRGACQPATRRCFPLEAMLAQIYLQQAEDSKYTHKDRSEDAQTPWLVGSHFVNDESGKARRAVLVKTFARAQKLELV